MSKNRFYLFPVILMFIFVTAKSCPALDINNYFPFKQGRSWNFVEEQSGETYSWTINGTLSLKNAGRVQVLMQEGNRFLCLKEDWEGLRIYGIFGPDKFYIPDTPITFLPRSINLDPNAPQIEASAQVSVFTDPDNIKNFKETAKETVITSFRAIGYADIKAGKKTFKDCIVIEKKITGLINITETLWLAPTIGPVKRVVTEDAETKTYVISPYSEPVDKKAFQAKDYFPLDPGTTRTYQDKEKTEKTTFMGTPETARLYEKALIPYSNFKNDICFFSLDNNGLILHQRYWADYGGLSAFPPPSKPAVFLPAKLALDRQHVSRTYPRSYNNRSMTLFQETHPEMELFITPLQTESITVPAGTFNDCIKVCTFYNIAVPSIQMGFMRSGYIWLAKGKGIVKEESLEMWNFALPEKPNSINEVRFWELASINIDTATMGKDKKFAHTETQGLERTDTPQSTKDSVKSKKSKKAEDLLWEGNSKKMFENIVDASPLIFRSMTKKSFQN